MLLVLNEFKYFDHTPTAKGGRPERNKQVKPTNKALTLAIVLFITFNAKTARPPRGAYRAVVPYAGVVRGRNFIRNFFQDQILSPRSETARAPVVMGRKNICNLIYYFCIRKI